MADRNAPATFTFEEWRVEFNELATDVGDITSLPTTINGQAVSDIVEAIAQLESGLSSVLFPTVIDFDDSTGAASERIKMGTDDDLQLFHDSNHSQVVHNGTGNLKIDSNNRTEVDATLGVDVQFNGVTKFSSTNTGIGIVGDFTDSSGTMSGTLTFPLIGGKIATEGFGIALAVALG
tara:strand:+ start:18 stop:551 length:534 start_codon:yes stop_codon:yes gene_type:complete